MNIFTKILGIAVIMAATGFSMTACEHTSKENNPGIVLSFDDYYPDTWEAHFDLFDKYNARVTFFVNGDSVTPFMLKAQDRGHEIGYHTINHPDLTKVSREDFFEETISRISDFKSSGIELTSFAYPFGSYREWMNYELLKHYRIVRGFGGNYGPHSIAALNYGFIDARSIDNIGFRNENKFRQNIDSMIRMAKASGKILTLGSHRISSDDWGITPERLEYVLREANKHGLTFYTHKDLQ